MAVVRSTLAVLGALAVSAAPAAAETAPLSGPPGASATKVLVVGTDGTRIDLVHKLVADGAAPRLAEIARTGFSAPSLLAYTLPEAATISEVGWATIATGVWPAKHGVNGVFINNDPRQATKNGYLDFLSRVEQVRPQLSTFIANNWANITQHENGGPIFGDAIDARYYVPAENTIDGWDHADRLVADAASRYLREGNPDAGFVYFGVVDETAHLDGSANPRYLQAIRDTDRRIGQLVDAIRARPTYLAERWLVVVTTDHGQQNLDYPSVTSHGFGSDLERMSFVAASGFGIDATAGFGDIRVVDIAPTALAWLDLPIDPAWRLDGRPFASAPGAPAPAATVRRLRGNRARIAVRALPGAPALKSVLVRVPRGSVRSAISNPRGRLTRTQRTIRLDGPATRLARIDLRLRRGRRLGRALRVTVTDVEGTAKALSVR
jgi:Type I phosphodiesterase / nucleotide pyrophosphatase